MKFDTFWSDFKSFVYCGSVGLCILSGVLLGALIGYYIDKWLNLGPIAILICLALGAIGGFKGAIKLIKRAIRE